MTEKDLQCSAGDKIFCDGAWHEVVNDTIAVCGISVRRAEKMITRIAALSLWVSLSIRCRSCYADDWRRGYAS